MPSGYLDGWSSNRPLRRGDRTYTLSGVTVDAEGRVVARYGADNWIEAGDRDALALALPSDHPAVIAYKAVR